MLLKSALNLFFDEFYEQMMNRCRIAEFSLISAVVRSIMQGRFNNKLIKMKRNNELEKNYKEL